MPVSLRDDRVKILVVDDQPSKLLTYDAILSELGEELIKANSATEALDALLKHEIAVVLADVCMPDLDGYELFQQIQQRHPDLPVVLMTAFHFDKDHVIKRSRLAGLEDVVYKKPIDPPRLRDIIKRHARRPQAATGS